MIRAFLLTLATLVTCHAAFPQNLFPVSGSAKLADPMNYPYGYNIDMTNTGSWAREYSITTLGRGKIFAMGAYGKDSTLTYGYIGGNTLNTLVHVIPWMVFKPDGKIGIGTTVPATKLDINGDMRVVNGLQKINFATGSNTNGYDLSIGANDDGVNFSSSSAGRGFNFNNNSGRLVTISSNAYLGVGVSSPVNQLHVVANNNTDRANSLLWGQYYGAAVGVPNTSNAYYAFHVMGNLNQNGTGGTGGVKSLFYVRADGNVGVGTAEPQARLAVNGDVFAKKVKVTQTGWPDYVFHESYQLPSLQEVETYIKAHRHLPGIPAAAEVEKDGLDIGEINRKMMQKIEEMTLYIIELKKENEEANKRYDALRLEIQQLKEMAGKKGN